MSKLLIRKDEMTLLKNSETAKNHELYGNLYDALESYTTLSEEEFKTNLSFDTKARSVILSNKKILFEAINDEWSAVSHSDEADGKIHCQLCGTPNKYVFYIHNKHNGIDLNVGSKCIEKFPGIANISQVKRSHKEQVKKQLEDKRRIEYDETDLDDITFVKDTEKWFSNFPLLLPYKLYSTIYDTIYSMNFLRTDYIKNGGNIDEIREKYFSYKGQIKELKLDANKFYEDYHHNDLICKKELADWLKDNHPDVRESIMKNNGLLTEDTLKFCYYNQYVNTNLKIFNSFIIDKDIHIVGMNGGLIRFAIKNHDFTHSVYFTMKSNIFMKNIGCHCLTNKTYKYGKQDLLEIKIETTSSNFNALYNRIKSPLNKIGLDLERGQYTNDVFYVRLPQILRTSNSGRKFEKSEIGYKKVAESYIFEIVTPILFESDMIFEKNFEKILKKLNLSTKWMSKSEWNNAENRAKSLSFQRQRDFVHYT